VPLPLDGVLLEDSGFLVLCEVLPECFTFDGFYFENTTIF